MKFSIITPTLQRESLLKCCQSVDEQSHKDWEHIVIADVEREDYRLPDLFAIQHDDRITVRTTHAYHNFGNTPRHMAWLLTTGDWVLYLDDDNYMAHREALADIAKCLESAPIMAWAIFPILRFGSVFCDDNPGCCHTDSANMVIQREVAQWPNRDEYTLDGIFCEELKAKYPFWRFPDCRPIVVVPVQSKGE